MADPYAITLAGGTLLGDVSWASTVGVDPYITSFLVPESDTSRYRELGRLRNAVSLVTPAGTFKKLSIVKVHSPCETPYHARVYVADRRWWWRFKWVWLPMNRRRQVGLVRREVQTGYDELIQQPLAPEFEFWAYTLRNGIDPWTRKTALRRWASIVEGGAPLYVVTRDGGSVTNFLRDLPIEEQMLNCPGNEALARILKYAPGMQPTIAPDGDIVLINVTDLSATSLVKRLGAPLVDGQYPGIMYRQPERPSKVIVKFNYKAEVPFHFLGDEVVHPDDPVGLPNNEATFPMPIDLVQPGTTFCARVLRNVAPFPDFTSLDSYGRKLTQGDYVKIYELLLLFATQTGDQKAMFTLETLRLAMIPDFGVSGMLDVLGNTLPDQSAIDWQQRMRVLLQHFRQTFQLPRGWVDRCLAIEPFLIATIDQATGQRAPAMIWGDYAMHSSDKKLFQPGSDDPVFISNMSGYPRNADFSLNFGGDLRGIDLVDGSGTANPRPMPARVELLSGDMGIIRLEFNTEPFRMTDFYLPSAVDAATKNDRTPGNRGQIYFNSITADNDGEICRLAEEDAKVVLLTLTPGRSLFEIHVTPEMAHDVLPPEMWTLSATADGPPMELFCDWDTARIMYSEAAMPAIEAVFGWGEFDVDSGGSLLADLTESTSHDAELSLVVTPYVTNYDDAGADKIKSQGLRSTAIALAAEIYARFTDRLAGTTAHALQPIIPQGAIDRVMYHFGEDGTRHMVVNAREEIIGVDPSVFLPTRFQRRLIQSIVVE